MDRTQITPTRAEYLLPVVGFGRFMKRSENIPYECESEERTINNIERGINRLALAHAAVIFVPIIAHELYQVIFN